MLDRLAAAVERHCEGNWCETAVPRLSLVSLDELLEPIEVVYEPMICFIAEGAKRTASGEQSWVTAPGEMLMCTLDLPVTAGFQRVPYRAVVMRIDGAALDAVQMRLAQSGQGAPPAVLGHVAAAMEPDLIDAVTRWVRLLDAPQDIGPLAGRIEEEILYRLLRSPLGPVLLDWSRTDSAAFRIRAAARWVREHYTEPLTVETIAEVARMSPATLHRHFRSATGMSPLRFQKHLRLQEARRLLFTGDSTAAQAAHSVGYVSATQFSREYRRAYGLPPAQDALRLRDRLGEGRQGPVLVDGTGAKP